MRLARLIMRIAYVSTRFLCVGIRIFSPRDLTNCPFHATLAKSTTSRHILTRIPTDYEQITQRNKTRIYI